jgi:hypothetical protein
MPPDRRLIALFGLLVVLLALAGYRWYGPATTATGAARATGRAARGGRAATSVAAPDVHLQALQEQRPEPQPERNLFRFKPKAPPPPPPRAAAPPPVATAPTGPPPPPPLAPIAMRFIGLVEAPEHAQKIAILSDGRGIYQGREGDIIEGRYRIVRIGVESVEMAYLDGRGRQTIRLSGS